MKTKLSLSNTFKEDLGHGVLPPTLFQAVPRLATSGLISHLLSALGLPCAESVQTVAVQVDCDARIASPAMLPEVFLINLSPYGATT